MLRRREEACRYALVVQQCVLRGREGRWGRRSQCLSYRVETPVVMTRVGGSGEDSNHFSSFVLCFSPTLINILHQKELRVSAIYESRMQLPVEQTREKLRVC